MEWMGAIKQVCCPSALEHAVGDCFAVALFNHQRLHMDLSSDVCYLFCDRLYEHKVRMELMKLPMGAKKEREATFMHEALSSAIYISKTQHLIFLSYVVICTHSAINDASEDSRMARRGCKEGKQCCG